MDPLWEAEDSRAGETGPDNSFSSRGQEDSPRPWRQGHYTHFRIKSCKRLTWGWQAGVGWGSPGPAPALSRRRRSAEGCLSQRDCPLHPAPGKRSSHSAAEPDPRTAHWGEGLLSVPQDLLAAPSSPHLSKWIAPPISSPTPRAQWKVPLPLRSPAALPGTLARLPGKAPDVTAARDPEPRPLSYPAFPGACRPPPAPPPGVPAWGE